MRFFKKGTCNLGRERESGFAARSAAVACTRRHLDGRGAVRMEARPGKRKPVVEDHTVDPRVSFRADFVSVLDTRAEGLNP